MLGWTERENFWTKESEVSSEEEKEESSPIKKVFKKGLTRATCVRPVLAEQSHQSPVGCGVFPRQHHYPPKRTELAILRPNQPQTLAAAVEFAKEETFALLFL